MKQLRYGFYGEDDAHKIFLQNYLQQFEQDYILFERDDDFCEQFRARNKKQVDTKFAFVAREGLTKYHHDIFFVGRDIDSHQADQFKIRQNHFTKERIKNLILMLPVQCVEHWLWLLKHRRENPQSTKNISFENYHNDKAKVEVYGRKDPPNELSNPIVDSLSSSFDVSWLESRSDSFKHFHNQVVQFLAGVQQN